MNDIKLVESNEQPMKNHLLSSHERIRSIYWAIELELRGWDIRSAFVGGTVSAIVYVTFLKYISDRRDQLGLQVSDLYRYDALLNLYPNVVNQQELCEYLGDVERQLGLSQRLLQNFVLDIKSPNLDTKFLNALHIANELDFRSNDIAQIEIEELVRIVEKVIESEGKVSGLVYTPWAISTLMSEICQIKDGMSVYDPCAGCGLSLIQAIRGKDVSVFAQEQNMHIAAILEMLLIMTGVRKGAVRCDDSIWHPLTQTFNQKFDCVISEPPYMRPETSYRMSIDKNLIGQVLYYPDQKIEDTWIFIRHIVASLKENGKAAVLVPMSMLTREGSAAVSRKKLIADGYIDSVIELPANAFSNRNMKTSIIILRKERPIHNIYMLDLSRGLWDEKCKTGKDGIAEITEMVLNRKIVTGASDIVETEEIVQNAYQLGVSRYVPQEIDVEQFLADSVKLYRTADKLEAKFERLCREFKEAMDDYNGYCNERKSK